MRLRFLVDWFWKAEVRTRTIEGRIQPRERKFYETVIKYWWLPTWVLKTTWLNEIRVRTTHQSEWLTLMRNWWLVGLKLKTYVKVIEESIGFWGV